MGLLPKRSGSSSDEDITNKKDIHFESTISDKSSPTKEYLDSQNEYYQEGVVHETKVKRGLKSRHVSMIALGGTIGTGLFVGTATPLSMAGPVNTLIAYIFFGTLAYSVTQSLGEMATHTPITGSFCVFNTKYISEAIGFATSWCYWFNWAVTFPIELFAIAQVIEYWTDAVPNWGWMLIFFFILLLANFFPVSYYGEIEFWISLVKVLAIVGFIIYALCMVCGAGKTGPVGFRYWRNPGPWGPGAGLVSNKDTDRFLGWLSSLINAAFTFQGIETTGVSAGESSNPRKAVPKAINKVIVRILLFYICTLFFIGLLVPFDDPALSDESSFISSSPFLISIKNSGTKILPDIFNAIMLMTIISAGNANIYLGSRTMYSMAGTHAPKCFGWTTKQGIPYLGVLLTAAIGLLAFLNVSNSGQTVFGWLVNLSATCGMISWICITGAHIRFMHVLRQRGIDRNSLPYKAKWMPFYAWYAFVALIIILFIQGYACFFAFTASDFFTNYITLIAFVVLWAGSQLTMYRKQPYLIPLEDVDIDSEARKIDAEVWDDPINSRFEKIWDTIF
ncbi:unnamed protein product [Ambrosiozyma monospora]|uniref:Unnamed protein product n=1 Tax=Ambrosiozyma monospora TaxID=43982 RepID=A0ACB5ST01_AMBMO|nr:unnamed protein product [Ambrosiozyma monospora]